MLVVFPPSETTAPGGAGAPLDLGKLGFPGLNPAREEIARDLVALCGQRPDEALDVLGISGRKADEVALTAELFDSPTAPALERYTGVLFDALDQESLPESAKGRLAVGSALFGLERGLDSTATRYFMGSAYPQPGLHGKFYDQDMQALIEVVRRSVRGRRTLLRHGTVRVVCAGQGCSSISMLPPGVAWASSGDGTRTEGVHAKNRHVVCMTGMSAHLDTVVT